MKFKKLTPNFSVKNVRETVKFYQDWLGFKLDMAVPVGSSVIEETISDQHEYVYAMMSRDEVYVMFIEQDSFGADITLLKGGSPCTSVLFYLDVENIDEIYNKLKENVELIRDLETTWYGMREFYIKDCNGYILGFAERA